MPVTGNHRLSHNADQTKIMEVNMKISRRGLSVPITLLLFLMSALLCQSLPDSPALGQIQIDAEPTTKGGEGGVRTLAAGQQPSTSTVEVDSVESLDKDSVEVATRTETTEEQIPIPLPGGLDYVANGTGTRNAGFGTIRLRGATTGAVIVKALLYWGVITSAPAPTSATAVFNGTTVTGSLIGTTAEPCWNFNGLFAAYRANVRTLMSSAIDGDYSIKGLTSSVTNGSNPWAPFVNTLPLSEGASLVVIYAHSSIPTSARVYLTNGPQRFDNGTFTYTHRLSPSVPSHTVAKQTRLGADGQVGIPIPGSGLKSFAGITNEQTFIGRPLAGTFTQIKGVGAPANQDSDWNGYDGDPLSKLWDTHTDDITGIVSAGDTSYNVRYIAGIDCSVWVVHILGVR
jgi:hypothetical protein